MTQQEAEGGPSDSSADVGRRWAVVIGVSQYQDPSLNLQYADRDAQAFYDFICSPAGGAFKAENVEFLVNESATVAAVNRALRSFLKKPAREDLVVIYLACHGSPDPDVPANVYLLTHEVDPDDVTSGVPIEEVHRAVRTMQAERVVIFADACHSASIGGGIGDRGTRDALAVNAYVTQLADSKPGVALLASCEAAQVSSEDVRWGGGHGVFTHFLLEGMKGAADAHPPNGTVTLGELFEYVRENVKEATNHRQHPSIGTGQFDRNLAIAVPGVSRARQLSEQASQLFAAGYLVEAEGLWQEALALNPADQAAKAGVEHIRQRRQESEETLRRRIVELNRHEESQNLSVEQYDQAMMLLKADETSLTEEDRRIRRRVIQLADRRIQIETYLAALGVAAMTDEPGSRADLLESSDRQESVASRIEHDESEPDSTREETSGTEAVLRDTQAEPARIPAAADQTAASSETDVVQATETASAGNQNFLRAPTTRWLFGLFTVCVLVWLGWNLIPVTSQVPDVVGGSEASARSTIRNANLAIGQVDKANSDSVEVGRVISTTPTAGTSLEEGHTVNLTISLGPVKATVPDVAGSTETEARRLLREARLNAGRTDTINSDSVKLGLVVSTDPEADTAVERNSLVDLVVSLGRGKLTVPDVIGTSEADARRAIQSAELIPGDINRTNSDSVPTGRVISMDPSAGASVAKNSAVNLTISSGPAKVAVPDVVGKSEAEAKRLIAAVDLSTGRVNRVNSDSFNVGQVVSTDPRSKVALEKGSAVDLTVSSGPAKIPVQYFEPELVLIPAGSFMMGSPEGEPGRGKDEGPMRKVTLSSFKMSRHEITFEEYDAFAEATKRKLPSDSSWGRGRRPVISVSWNDAQAYVLWLREQTGRTYRLPTEAEWEYAARAGTSMPFWTGKCLPTTQANYHGNYPLEGCLKGEYREKTVPVGSLGAANPFGLHDMHGNVWEWVQDCYSDNYSGAPVDGTAVESGECSLRVLRGGSWYNFARFARSAFRNWSRPDNAYSSYGFRVVVDLARTD